MLATLRPHAPDPETSRPSRKSLSLISPKFPVAFRLASPRERFRPTRYVETAGLLGNERKLQNTSYFKQKIMKPIKIAEA